jgi:hypothetical protein
MWRNVLDGSRDFYAIRIKDGSPAGEAAKQGTGTWKLNACPMDGGGIVARDGQLASAWRRESDIYLAEPGKPEIKLGAGKDVALAINQQGLHAIWNAPEGITLFQSGQTTKLAAKGGFPAIIRTGDGTMLAAWEDDAGIAIVRL